MKYLSTTNSSDQSDILAKPIDGSEQPVIDQKPKAVPLHRYYDNVMANVNPFTPPGMLIRIKKRTRSGQDGNENLKNSMSSLAFSTATNKSNVFRNHLGSNFKGTTDIFNVKKDHHHDEEVRQAPKRLALQDSNISRYEKEFLELSILGVGEFGLVYQCVNRLDGCVYAIKKSIKPVAGSI